MNTNLQNLIVKTYKGNTIGEFIEHAIEAGMSEEEAHDFHAEMFAKQLDRQNNKTPDPLMLAKETRVHRIGPKYPPRPVAPHAAEVLAEEDKVYHSPEREHEFYSQRYAARIGFAISANIGKLATRIQRMANPPKGTVFDPTETKAEIRELVARIIWGYNNIPDHMRPIDEAVAEWAGGGYSRPKSNEELAEVSEALGISAEQAKQVAETNRLYSRDYLAIRRQGLAPVMVAKIEGLLSSDMDGIAPDDDTLKAQGEAAFQNAVLWGDWAEAQLIKADMLDLLGCSPAMPAADKSQAEKAERIRESLAARQAEQAERDSRALMEFDIDLN